MIVERLENGKNLESFYTQIGCKCLKFLYHLKETKNKSQKGCIMDEFSQKSENSQLDRYSKKEALVLYQKMQDESEKMYTYILENKMCSMCIILKPSLA